MKSRRDDKCRGTVHGTARNWTVCSLVSMIAPSDLNTALEIKKGVVDSTIAILSQNLPIGIKIAELHMTVPLFPNLNVIDTGCSRTLARTCLGISCRKSCT